jgi:hypothetical protein
MRRILSTPTILLVLAGSSARAADLATFLDAASKACHPSAIVRADGVLRHQNPDQNTSERIVLFRSPDDDVYVELQKSGDRALIKADGSAYLRAGSAGSVKPFEVGDALGGTNFTREDLEPFDVSRYGSPTIIDRSAKEITVSLAPQRSQYSLVVITFDRQRKTPIKALLYEETYSNLVKMERYEDRVRVAGTWLPQSVTMEHFKLRGTSTMELEWREASDAPAGLFERASLDQPSPVKWPAKEAAK